MWRSKGRDLIRATKRALSIQSQVSPSISIVIPSLPTQFSYKNFKLFSVKSNPIDSALQTFDETRSFNTQGDRNAAYPTALSKYHTESYGRTDSSVFEGKLFVEMPQINNVHVESVIFLCQNSLDKSFESSLDKMGLTLNEEFMVRVIETPLVPGESLIRFFKWALKRSDFSVNSHVVNCLVKAIGTGLKKREIFSLWDLVKDVGGKEKGVVDTHILNQLISLFWKLGRGKVGLEVFDKFEEFGCRPNVNSYYYTIEALYRCSMFDDAWSVCEKMLKAEEMPESFKIGHIISCFSKGNQGEHAHSVYLTAMKKNIRPPLSSIKHLIRALCRENDTVKLALNLLDNLRGDARKYATKLFCSVLFGLCNIRDVKESKRLLSRMINEGPPPGSAVFNSVINLLSKAGQMEEVLDLLNIMELRGMRPDVCTYCVIMSGYAKRGQMKEACRVFSDVRRNHPKLSPCANDSGYCKVEEFDKALELLSEMKKEGIKPNADEYNKMIQALCLKALDWRTAEKLLEEMNKNGLQLSGITQCLIRAIKELEEYELNAERIGSLDPSRFPA